VIFLHGSAHRCVEQDLCGRHGAVGASSIWRRNSDIESARMKKACAFAWLGIHTFAELPRRSSGLVAIGAQVQDNL